jgi:hypothetical protein
MEYDYLGNLKETMEFANSPRGNFIMAKALYLGIQKLGEVQGVHREVSDILDMRHLLDVLHPGMEGLMELEYPKEVN